MLKFKYLMILVSLCLCACSSSKYKSLAHDSVAEDEPTESEILHSPSVERDHSRQYGIDWPVDQARLTQPFHLSGRRPHLGIDLAAPRGSRVYSAHYGTVVYTGSEFHGYGKLVIVEQNSSWATFYSHLDRMMVREGQMIEQGQLVGLMGRSGNARGVHLHFELRNHRDPVDPLQFLPQE